MNYSLFELWLNFKIWLLSLIQLNFQVFDVLLITAFVLFMIGLVNTAISMNLIRESKRKLLLYPIMMIYSTFLTYVFIKSIFQELLGRKMKWVKAEI